MADELGISTQTATQLAQTAGVPLGRLKGLAKGDRKQLLWELRHPEHAPRMVKRNSTGSSKARLGVVDWFQKQRGHGTSLELVTSKSPARPFDLLVPSEAPNQGWEWLGPSNIGGRTRSIYVEDNASGRVWIASPAGGVWLSRDVGATWRPAGDTLLNLAVTSIVADPVDADVLYAGTGEGFFNEDAIRGGGIFSGRASKETGQNWARLPGTDADEFAFITRLATVKSPPALLVATDRGLFRLPKPGMTPARVTSAESMDLMLDVECDGAQPANCVAGDLHGQSFFSADGGRTWKRSNLVPAEDDCRVELAIAQADSNVVYASVDTGGGMVFRSVNRGESFVSVNSTHYNYLGNHGWYDDTVWAGDPHNANLVVIGGTSLYRSNDGAHSFDVISSPDGAKPLHSDVHVVAAAAGNTGAQSVFVGTDGGVFWTSDITTVGPESGWESRNKGYGASQFYSAARSGGTLLGGTQDNGTLLQDDSNVRTWREVLSGDGGVVVIDSTDLSCVYAESNHLSLQRSTDGGKTFEPIDGEFWDGQQWRWRPDGDLRVLPDATSETSTALIAPFELDRANPNRMLAGGLSLWQTTTLRDVAGPTWREILTPRTVGDSRSLIRAIALSPDGKVWVGYEDGAVVSLQQLGSDPFYTPIPMKIGIPPLDKDGYRRRTLGIDTDPGNSQRVFASFSGYAATADNLWCSPNGGATWANASMGLPPGPVYTVLVAPDEKTMYLGAEQGLFAAVGDPKTCPTLWHRAETGAINCSVRDLKWDKDRVLIATHGRGVFSWKP